MNALIAALPFAVAGATLSFIHFGVLRWNVALLLTPKRRTIGGLLVAARMLLIVGCFTVVAQVGAAALLAALIGFAGIRPLLLRSAGATQ